jgi:protein TonB
MLAGAGTTAVLAGAALLLSGAFNVSVTRIQDEVLALVDVHPPVAPPPRPKPVVMRDRAKGAPSPRNLSNKATDVALPPPVIPVLVSPPLIAATAPDIGAATNSGASDRTGPGRGAGGQGDGEGGGGNGGDGDGTPPRWIRGRLSFGDLPADLRATGWNGKVGVRYAVGVDGRATDCRIDQTSGNPAVDALTCRSIEERFRFRPARDEAERPVRSVIVETHEWIVQRPPDGRG